MARATHTLYLIRGNGLGIHLHSLAVSGGDSPTIEKHCQALHDKHGYEFRRCRIERTGGEVIWLPTSLSQYWAQGESFTYEPSPMGCTACGEHFLTQEDLDNHRECCKGTSYIL